MLDECGLDERRNKLIDKFVLKTQKTPRFSEEWFPHSEQNSHDLRTEKKFKEYYERTNRLYKSPIYTYRRRLNELTNN